MHHCTSLELASSGAPERLLPRQRCSYSNCGDSPATNPTLGLAVRTPAGTRTAGAVGKLISEPIPANVRRQRPANRKARALSQSATTLKSTPIRYRPANRHRAPMTPTAESILAWRTTTGSAVSRIKPQANSAAGSPARLANPPSTRANAMIIAHGRANISNTTGLNSWETAFRSRSVSNLVMDAIIPEGSPTLDAYKGSRCLPLGGVCSTIPNFKVSASRTVRPCVIFCVLDQGVMLR